MFMRRRRNGRREESQISKSFDLGLEIRVVVSGAWPLYFSAILDVIISDTCHLDIQFDIFNLIDLFKLIAH
ncbi:hypothetical protein KFK09_019516 [Dendrobium nobile]|uniref:Uncharacterized protein n=1 Tax=Dendrobium nobile TaxID=94219 RepID=A0A8T3APP6_DENNO|nr:hypothetical protein KFK09_019516 [Dendrobium nobile]